MFYVHPGYNHWRIDLSQSNTQAQIEQWMVSNYFIIEKVLLICSYIRYKKDLYKVKLEDGWVDGYIKVDVVVK